MNQSFNKAKVTQIMRRIAQARLPGGVRYFVGKEPITGPGNGSDRTAKETRLKELEAKTNLTSDERDELDQLRKELRGNTTTQTDHRIIPGDKSHGPRISGVYPAPKGAMRWLDVCRLALIKKLNGK